MTRRRYRWQLYPQNRELSTKIAERIGRPSLVGQLLLNRQLKSLSSVEAFLSPTRSPVDGTAFFTECRAAVDLIRRHISDEGRILIYGDYDVDGITSTSMMTEFLRCNGAQVDFYIPHRFKDGYGLSESVVDRVRDHAYSLLITLDCGVTNVREIGRLKSETSCDVIVMDHHTIPDTVPDADVMVNPKVLSEDHPLWGLCAAGIVWRFVEFAVSECGLEGDPAAALDLACLGTIADIAPLVGENRWICQQGLADISARRRLGLRCLLAQAASEKSVLDSRDVGFVIGPRLNAAGRLADANQCVELLISTDYDEAQRIARHIDGLNTRRREIGEDMMTQIDQVISENPQILDHHIIALYADTWHAGVVGIIASRVAEKYCRPVVLMAVDDQIARASARSYGNVNLYALLKETSEYFDKFGGHAQAAGFTIQTSKIPDFVNAIVAVSDRVVGQDELSQHLDIEGYISADEISLEMVDQLEGLGPFGEGNPKPILYTRELTPIDFRRVGDGRHLKVRLQDRSGRKIVDAIGFGLGDQIELLYKDAIELAFSLDRNEWNGAVTAQLQLVDIKSS